MPGRLYQATMGRAMAALYDRMFAATEDAGLRDRRRALVGRAHGRVLELGAGTGLNLAHYGPEVAELVLLEPDPNMGARLRRKVGTERPEAQVVTASAERLPFEDASFDTVVCTLVLCTVEDPARVAGEVARVLKPGGRFLFLEHVRSEDPDAARRQDRIRPVWAFVGGGCQCNRDTLALLERSPLAVEQVEHGRIPKAPSWVRPAIDGVAARR